MAVLTDEQLARLRRGLAQAKGAGIDWTKPQINAAFQSVEDYLDTAEGGRPSGSLGAAIDASTAPYVLSVGDKRTVLKLAYDQRGRP